MSRGRSQNTNLGRKALNLKQEMFWRIGTKFLRASFSREGVAIRGKVIFIGDRESFRLEKGCSLYASPGSSVLASGEALLLRTIGPEARIEIGTETGITCSTIVAHKHIEIGRDCIIGAGCLIIDSDFHGVTPGARRDRGLESAKTSPIHIGDQCFVGARSIILKGVTLPAGTVIPAGSTVIFDNVNGFRLS